MPIKTGNHKGESDLPAFSLPFYFLSFDPTAMARIPGREISSLDDFTSRNKCYLRKHIEDEPSDPDLPDLVAPITIKETFFLLW